jgi:hypothetical protein
MVTTVSRLGYKRDGRKIYVQKGKNWHLWRVFPSQKKARRKMTRLRERYA